MNWTGGRLQNSKASKGVTARQKQHFARVQQDLRNGAGKKFPVKWTVFDMIVEERERVQRGKSMRQSSRGLSGERSQSLQPRHDTLAHKRHPIKQEPASNTAWLHKPSQNSRRHRTPNEVTPEPERVADDDLYNATPPKQSRSRYHEPIPVLEVESVAEYDYSITEKRRKILRKGDWVGLTIQKPIGFSFASPGREEHIGKRRRLTEGNRARYNTRQTHVTSPFQKKSVALPRFAETRSHHQHPLDSRRADVKISIGSKVVPPGISSSSVAHSRRVRSVSEVTRMSNASRDASSDVMLLGTGGTPARPPHTLNIQKRQQASDDLEPSPARIKIRRQTSNLKTINSAAKAQQESLDKYSNNDVYRGGIADDVSENIEDGNEPAPGTSPRKSEGGSVIDYKAEPFPPNLSVFGTPTIGSDGFNPRIFPKPHSISSSSVSLQHPMPRSSKSIALQQLLIHSESSDIAASTAAQIGESKPLVPSSQVLDDEAWKTWFASVYNNGTQEDNHNDAEISISPGISTAAPMRPLESRGGSSSDEARSYIEYPKASSQELGDLSNRPCSQSSSEKSAVDINEVEVDLVGTNAPDSRSGTVDETPIFATAAQFVPQVVVPKQPARVNDEDEIWRKFVFGESSDEDDDSGLEPQHIVVTQPERDSCSSVSLLAQPTSKDSRGSWEYPLVQVGNKSSSSLEGRHRSPPGSSQTPSMASNSPRSSISSEKISIRAVVGSVRWPGADRVTSMAIHSKTSAFSPAVHMSSSRAPRKILFTKLKPFIGRRPAQEPVIEKEPLHIGKGLKGKGLDHSATKKPRRERDVYSLISSEGQDMEDDVESIEED